MPMTVDEPSAIGSDTRHCRLRDGVWRRFGLSTRLNRYETWLVYCLVYVPVIPLFSAAILGGYLYVRSHRTVYLVNGLPVPIVVDVDGRHSVSLGPHGHSRLSMTEGAHRAAICEPQIGIEPVDFRIGSVGRSGLLSSPTFVVDPTRSAILVWEESSGATAKDGRLEAQSRAHLGEAFLAYSHVDYAFEEFPKDTNSHINTPPRKTRISLVAAPAEKLVQAILASPDRSNDTIGLIENQLRASPDDVSLLSGYWAVARRRGEIERCREFLAARLTDRPVLVDWHRLYQTVSEDVNDSDALIEEYDTWLAADPSNSALLYLRGRCEPDREQALRFYERSIAADPENAYPRFAASGVFLSRGAFRQAEAAARIAYRLQPDNVAMKRQLTRARMALKQYDELETDLRTAWSARPSSLDDQERLLAVWVAANKLDQAREALNAFGRQASASASSQDPGRSSHLRNMLLYFEGDFQSLLAATAPPADAGESALPRYQALFELRKEIAPPAGLKPLQADHDGYSLLCQALAWAEQGNGAAAAEARKQAIEQFRAGRSDDRRAAEILANGDRWADDDIDQLPLDPTHKCILLLAMADISVERAKPLLDLADKLNFERRFPYHFLKSTIERLRRR